MTNRLTDEQYERIIAASGNPTSVEMVRPLIQKMNDDEKSYMRSLINAKRQGQGTAYESVKRLRKIQEPQPRQPVQAPSTTSPTLGKMGVFPPTYQGSTPFADIQQRRQEGGMEGRLGMPQFNEQDASDAVLGMFGEAAASNPDVREAAQTGMNIPGSVLNLPLGLADMAWRGAKVPYTSAKAAVTGDVATERLAVQQTEQFVEEMGNLAYTFFDVPKSAVNAVLYGTAQGLQLNTLTAWMNAKGINATDFSNYIRHDPVGTALFMFPWVKAAATARTPPPKPPLKKVAGELAQQKQKIAAQKADAPVAFDNIFIDVKEGVPEAIYKFTEDVVDFGKRGEVKAGETVLSSELAAAGYEIKGPKYDRRAPGRPTDVSYQELLATRINEALAENPDLGPDNPAFWKLTEEHERAVRGGLKEKSIGYYTKLQKEAADLGIKLPTVEEAWPRSGARMEDLQDAIRNAREELMSTKVQARYQELLNSRQPGDAITIKEAVEAVKNFSPSYKYVKDMLTKRMYQENVITGSADMLDVLYDEAMLARPDLTRKQIKRINHQYAQAILQNANYVGVPTEWLVEQVAVARALRGLRDVPITTPNGIFNASRTHALKAAADRVAAFYDAEIKASETLPRVAQEFTSKLDLTKAQLTEPGMYEVGLAEERSLHARAVEDVVTGEIEASKYEPLGVRWPKADAKRDRPSPPVQTFETDVEGGARGIAGRPNESAAQAGIGAAQAAASAGINAANATHAHATQGAVRSAVGHVMGTAAHGATATNVLGQLQSSVRNFLNAFAPSTRQVANMNKNLGDLFNQAASSDGYVTTISAIEMMRAEKAIRDAVPGISDKLVKEKMKLFARKLNSEAARAAEARNAAELSEMQAIAGALRTVSGRTRRRFVKRYRELQAAYRPQVNVPRLTPQEEALFMQDPAMAGLSQWWLGEMQPLIENFATEAGIESSLTSPDGYYSKINYDVDPASAPRGAQIVTINAGGPSIYQKATGKARASKRRTAHMPTGMVIVDDLDSILTHTLKDRVGRAAKNSLINELIQQDLTGVVPKGGTVSIGGKTYGVRTINVLDKNQGKTLLLPEPYAKAWDHMTNISRDKFPVLGTAVRLTVGSALLVPAEATMHALNVAFAAIDTGGKFPYARTAPKGVQFFVDHTLPGRALGLAYDMWNQSGRPFEDLVARMARAGALRTSGYKHVGFKTAATQTGAALKKGKLGEAAGGLGTMAHETFGFRNIRDYVFGIPNFKKTGLRGIETRARAAMWKAIERIDPTLTDAQIANIINDRVGTYVKEMEPQWVRASLFVDPFARAGTAAIKTSLKSTAQATLMPWQNHRNSVMLYTTIGTYFMVTHAMTGKWPWEMPNLKPGDIPVPAGKDAAGNDRYRHVPFRLWYNTPYRAFNMTGLRTTAEAYVRGERSIDGLADEWGRGMANAMLSRLGPPGRAVFTGAFKGAPYISRTGGLLKTGEQRMPGAGKVWAERVKPSMQVAVPLWNKWDESMDNPTTPEKQSPLWKYLEMTGKTLGIEAPLHTFDRELGAAGSIAADRRRILGDIVRGVAYDLANVPPDERNLYVLKKLQEQTANKQELMMAYQQLIRILGNLPRRYTNKMVDKALTDMYKEGDVETPILPQQ